ncbi:restriction endonuclease subunit S [Listeria monocytogenes]|uniref:restriction endonuclease subunit S n=4 Tax=Listeria monocytogenes TaxID=1639 RepID=UPI000430B600|nr:restriction endonuclease subunit S [Listeria monocytogenes]EAE6147617.1 restriction endonuclease subunit S [Listeria monocytogenes serotype 1/2a]AHF34228.1 type I restriction enzyme, S subunit [Listeria monocytogenes serotype 1/2a str. 08-6997]APV11496.1 type I restriction endonuclease [Listeria monocytogenes]ASG99033.1 type I restriction enzyme, S subunit [Listeria monocytogenes serotype 1/2a str. 10-5024]ASH07879.1 type I restriction enzyme, S subunit [Listeria monocytogenes serotype 1/2a
MKKLEKSVPVIRFKGFSEAWEQRELSSLLSFSNGINAPKEHYGKGRKMISVMDILDEKPVKYEFIRNSVQVDKKIESKNKVEYGDIVFVRSSEVPEEVGWAKAYLEKEYALYSGFSIRGKKINEFNPYFVELTLNSINRKQIERKAGGSTRFNVSQTILSSIELLMPEIEEQNKIDKFFIQLDTTIALHQRKLDALKLMKKGFLQQMFPKIEADIPEIRFADFDGKWEQRKLGEIFNERSERSADGELISVTINSGVIKASKLEKKDNSSFDKSNYKVVKKGDIAYNSMRMWQGASGYSSYDGILSPAYTVIYPRKDIDTIFIAYMFKKIDMIQTFQRNSQGLTSDTWNLKFPSLSTIKIKIPANDEQIKITNLFQKLEYTSILHQNQIEMLKKVKKAYLQTMFI